MRQADRAPVARNPYIKLRSPSSRRGCGWPLNTPNHGVVPPERVAGTREDRAIPSRTRVQSVMGSAPASLMPAAASLSRAAWRMAVSSRVWIWVMRAQRMDRFCMKMLS
jgi:hypothetical protein